MTRPAPAGTSPLARVYRFGALLLVGVVAGLMAGIFGVGGGLFMVPLLVWLLGFDQRRAVATSLAAVVPTALAAGAGYFVRGEVDVLAGAIVAAGGVVGSLVGSKLLAKLSLEWLRWLFLAFMVAAAVRIAFYAPTRGGTLEYDVWSVCGLVALGVVMGIAGGLFGIGSGIIAVPAFMTFYGMDDLLAKGTSLLAMVPAAVTGTVKNSRAGLLVVLDAVVIGVSAVGASFAGVAVAFLLDPRVSSILFAVLILVVATQLAVRSIRERKRHRPAGGTREIPAK